MKKRLLTVAWLVVFLSLLLCVIFSRNGAIDLYRLKSESDRLACINDDLEKENQILYRRIGRLKDDPQYMEEVARKELGMVARDEFIYQFKGGKKAE